MPGAGSNRRGDGKIDPAWQLKRKSSWKKTWSLDGLPPNIVNNARFLAGQILADAKRGRRDNIKELIDGEKLDDEQRAVLLGATDLANGNTALILAARSGHAETCALLLDYGADPLAQNNHRQTARDVATSMGHENVVMLLDKKREQDAPE